MSSLVVVSTHPHPSHCFTCSINSEVNAVCAVHVAKPKVNPKAAEAKSGYQAYDDYEIGLDSDHNTLMLG
jgi:hypothetical protein